MRAAGERARREGAVAGLAVARDGLHERAEQRAGRPVGERAVPAHAVAAAEEARAEHVVGAPARDRLEHAREARPGRTRRRRRCRRRRRSPRRARSRGRCEARRRARARPGASARARRARARSRAWRRASRRRRGARRRACRRPRSEARRARRRRRPPRRAPRRSRDSAGGRLRATAIEDARRPASPPLGRSQPGTQRAPAGPRTAAAAAPRAAPSRREIVAASSSTERGSRETAPGSAPSPQTTNGTGRSPQSRWPWPPIPRPWPWSAIRITVAPSSLPRSSRKARNVADAPVGLGELVEVLGAAHAAHVAELVGRQQLEHEQVRVLLRRPPGAPRRPASGRSRAVGCTDVTERTTSSPNGSSRCAIPTSRPRRPSRSSTSKTDSLRTPSRGAKFERMPCSAGVAPVSIEEKQTTVRAG